MAVDCHILTEEIATQTGAVGHIILNRPQAYNALTHEMILSMTSILETWRDAKYIQAVLITSSNKNAFCAGGDVRKIHDIGRTDPAQAMQFFHDEYRLNFLIHRFHKAFICVLDGITMGGGVGVSLHGSHRIATSKLMFAMPETAIGFFPDIGASYLLNQCPGELGVYLGLTGARINIDDAYYAGLVDYHLGKKDIENFIESLQYSDLQRQSKKEVSLLLDGSHQAISPSTLAEKRDLIDHCFAGETIDQIMSRLANCNDSFATQAISLLEKMSPTSLAVSLRHIRTTRGLTVAEGLQRDFRLASQFITEHDFYEGVRAALVDKDRKPQWQPANISELDQSEIEKYFQEIDHELQLD